MNFSQYHNRVIRQRDVTQELYKERELIRRLLETLNSLPENADTTRGRFRFLTREARLNEAIRRAELMDHRLSLMGSVARYDSNGNNTNSPDGRNSRNSPNSGNNTGPPNSGNNTSSSSNTNNRDVNTSSNTRNISRYISIIIIFTLFVFVFISLVFISIVLYQFSCFEVTLVNCSNFLTLSPFDFTSLSSLSF
jgi:hypothetical protein